MSGNAQLRFLLVDDDAITPEYEKQALEQAFPGSACVISTSVWMGKQALVGSPSVFSLVLLDLLLPDGSGTDILDFMKLHEKLRAVPVIITSGVSDISVAQQCRMAGASGYIPRTELPTDLISAVKTVLSGGEYFPGVERDTSASPGQVPSDDELPERLARFAKLLGSGRANKDVAAELNVQEVTVRNALPELMRFFRVSTRGELMRVLSAKYGSGQG